MADLPPNALASLVAIAEHGSVSAAARARGLTQPSISRQIQDLERELDCVLLERTAQGARLTPAGEVLVEGARDVLMALARLPERVKEQADQVSGTIRLGAVDSIGIYVLPQILARFAQEHPRVRVQVVCQSSPSLMAMLVEGELDVAVGTTEHPKLMCERLYQNPLVLAYSPATPEAQVPTTVAALARKPIITFAKGLTVRTLLDQAFAKAGIDFQPVVELANVEVIKAMVRAGLGFGIIPDGCVEAYELRTRPIKGIDVSRTIRLMHRDEPHSLGVQKLIAALRTLQRK